MKFELGSIKQSPYRDTERYPLKDGKVEQLKESIRTTGFWDNIVARVVDGVPQIAYGHHRLKALQDLFKSSDEIELIVKDISNETMLQMMARENAEEYGSSASNLQESVAATVRALGAGEIELGSAPAKTPKNQLRFAPGFSQGDLRPHGGAHPYTSAQIAGFIGSNQTQVKTSLAGLELIEAGVVDPKWFDGVTKRQSEKVIKEVRSATRAERHKLEILAKGIAEAVEAGDDLREHIRTEEAAKVRKEAALKGNAAAENASKTIQDAWFKASVPGPRKEKPTPDIGVYASRMMAKVDKVLAPKNSPKIGLVEDIIMLSEYTENMNPSDAKGIENALVEAAHRAMKLAELFAVKDNRKTAVVHPITRLELV